jgi:hypothetical protein
MSVAAETGYVIRNQQAQTACTLANIGKANQKLVTFRQLREGINQSMRLLESSKGSDEFFSNAIGEAVEKIYGVAVVGADMAGTKMAGGRINSGQVGDLAKAGGGLFGDGVGGYLASKVGIMTNMLIGAFNKDDERVKGSAVDTLYANADFTLDALDATKSAAFLSIGRSLYEYKGEVDSILQTHLNDSVSRAENHTAQKITLLRSARNLDRTIAKLESFIASCEAMA